MNKEKAFRSVLAITYVNVVNFGISCFEYFHIVQKSTDGYDAYVRR